MKTYCKYHPLEPSRWYCSQCFSHLCRSCVPVGDDKRHQASCPVCHKPLRYLGGSNLAQPFWNRLAEFFRYPLAKDPILLILICTILPLFSQGLILSLVVTIALAAIQTRYLYGIIEHTAEGNLSPPSLGSAFQGGGLNLLIQQLLVLAGMVALQVFALQSGGAVLGILTLAFLVLIFPASVMVLAVEKSALQAINPIRLMAIIGAIGWPYFVLYGYLVLVFLSLGVAQEFILVHFDPMIGFPLLGFTSSYFLIVIFHMLGYLLFQYQYQLGFSADLADEEPVGPTNERQLQARNLVEIDIGLKDGQYERAADLMLQEFRRRPQDLILLDRLYRLLWEMKSWRKLQELAPPLLRMLVTQSRFEAAATLLRQFYAQDDFVIADPLLSFDLAQTCYNLQEYKLVLRLLKDMHKDFPEFEFLPEAYVLVAKALANGIKDKAKAQTYLKFVQKQFPEHAVQARLASYFESLQSKGLIL